MPDLAPPPAPPALSPNAVVQTPEPEVDLQTPAPEPDFGDGIQDPDLDALHADPPKSEPKKDDPKPADKAPEPKPADKPVVDKLTVQKDIPANTPQWFRKEMKAKQVELDTATSELATVKAKLTKMETTAPKAGADTKALSETLAAKDKRLTELEQEIKMFRYEKSDEFKTKFEQPYIAAQKRAQSVVTQLTVKSADAEGNETTRPGTVNDLNLVLGLPEGAAWRKANELFGTDAQVIWPYYQKMSEISQESTRAIEEYRGKAAEHEQHQTAQQAREQEATASMWSKANAGFVAKYPKWFAPIEGDTEGNAVLEKGYQTVDAAFNNRESMTPQQRVILDAKIRNYAAGFPRMVHLNKQLQTKIAALETELAEFKESGPGPGKRATGDKPPVGDSDYVDADKALDSLG